MIITKKDFNEIRIELLWINGEVRKLNQILHFVANSFDVSNVEDEQFNEGVRAIIENLALDSSFIHESFNRCMVDMGEISRREQFDENGPAEFVFDPDHTPALGEPGCISQSVTRKKGNKPESAGK